MIPLMVYLQTLISILMLIYTHLKKNGCFSSSFPEKKETSRPEWKPFRPCGCWVQFPWPPSFGIYGYLDEPTFIIRTGNFLVAVDNAWSLNNRGKECTHLHTKIMCMILTFPCPEKSYYMNMESWLPLGSSKRLCCLILSFFCCLFFQNTHGPALADPCWGEQLLYAPRTLNWCCLCGSWQKPICHNGIRECFIYFFLLWHYLQSWTSGSMKTGPKENWS